MMIYFSYIYIYKQVEKYLRKMKRKMRERKQVFCRKNLLIFHVSKQIFVCMLFFECLLV